MYEKIILCEFCVADLTNFKPNAYYEWGMRYTVKPLTTIPIIASSHFPLLFDVGPNRTFAYQVDKDINLSNNGHWSISQNLENIETAVLINIMISYSNIKAFDEILGFIRQLPRYVFATSCKFQDTTCNLKPLAQFFLILPDIKLPIPQSF